MLTVKISLKPISVEYFGMKVINTHIFNSALGLFKSILKKGTSQTRFSVRNIRDSWMKISTACIVDT